MGDQFRRNGFEVSWASAVAKIDNDEYYGFTGVDYEEKLERALARGTGRAQAPRGMTAGQYSVDGSVIKLYKASALALISALAAKSPDRKSYGNVTFYFSLQYLEDDVSIHEELFNCRISGRKASAAQGPDALVDELPLTVEYAKVNGLTLFDNRQGRY